MRKPANHPHRARQWPRFERAPATHARSSVLFAFNRVRRLLSDDPNCQKFLKSGIAGGSDNVFKQLLNQITDLIGPAVLTTGIGTLNGVTGYIGSGYYITINARGAFYSTAVGVGIASQYSSQLALIRGGTASAQNFILLHELAHFLGAENFMSEDATNMGYQKANYDLLFNNCQTTIAGGGPI